MAYSICTKENSSIAVDGVETYIQKTYEKKIQEHMQYGGQKNYPLDLH
jgi:hypothetical protein